MFKKVIKKPWDCGERRPTPRSSCRGSTAWKKISQNNAQAPCSHVYVEADVVGGVEEVIANPEVDHVQDEDKEDLQSEGDIADDEVNGEVEDEEEEGYLVDDEECPGGSACQKLWHLHSERGPSFE